MELIPVHMIGLSEDLCSRFTAFLEAEGAMSLCATNTKPELLEEFLEGHLPDKASSLWRIGMHEFLADKTLTGSDYFLDYFEQNKKRFEEILTKTGKLTKTKNHYINATVPGHGQVKNLKAKKVSDLSDYQDFYYMTKPLEILRQVNQNDLHILLTLYSRFATNDFQKEGSIIRLLPHLTPVLTAPKITTNVQPSRVTDFYKIIKGALDEWDELGQDSKESKRSHKELAEFCKHASSWTRSVDGYSAFYQGFEAFIEQNRKHFDAWEIISFYNTTQIHFNGMFKFLAHEYVYRACELPTFKRFETFLDKSSDADLSQIDWSQPASVVYPANGIVRVNRIQRTSAEYHRAAMKELRAKTV